MQKEINKFENERNEIERCLYFLNGNDNLSNEEVAFLEMHITQKKRELVNKTFKEEHPRGKICNKTKRGYLKPTGINIFATTEEELYEKLYNFYFPSYATLNDIYVSWIHKRLEKNKTIGKPSAKTIQEDIGYWTRILSKEELVSMPINKITAADIDNLYTKWTGNGNITHKEFSNRKSLLTALFSEAVILGCIPDSGFVTSIKCNAYKFKSPLAKNQGQCEQDIQHNLGHSNIQQTQHYDSHATTEYNYGMAADIYDKKYNVTKCNQTFEHKKIAPNLDKLKAWGNSF